MKLSTHVVAQMALLAIQAINQTMDLLSPRHRQYATVALTVLQGVVGIVNHFANPDGTAAETAWVSKEDKK